MRNAILVFVGGGIGSMLRFIISNFAQNHVRISAFSAGTFTVNMVGCLLMGFLVAIIPKLDTEIRLLLTTGFCGGFTTFSAFSAENYQLLQQGKILELTVYIFASIIFGLLAVGLGYQLGRSNFFI